MKKFFTIILSIIIIIAGFAIVIGFDTVKGKINQTEVVVANTQISFKDEIKEEHLVVESVPTDQVLEQSFTPEEAEQIIGSYAAIDIPKGQQIHITLLDSFDLIPNKADGEFIAAIPEEWLFTVPQSLRKSYLADFYIIPTDEKKMVESMSSGEQEQFITNDRIPILQNIRISSVKNSSNSEVETVVTEENTESTTGTISNMEIIANDDILNVLRAATGQGYQLYVVYTLERDGNEDREVIINADKVEEIESNKDNEESKENEDESEDE
ncbi:MULTISPECIES: SAF domain-containing protein [Oceanobacillus]|uniref:SAF domain-containing protein n=1 Tax=Oceanobacillus kimchii TaxID=746691 RepID=A0ABQ5TR96_9BACI|nr:SAF domain-containing protein [Oceanobacillus kimchii]GLO68278.1 hypothetical protein MACH08_40620 [Oceanobacillus kimchii]